MEMRLRLISLKFNIFDGNFLEKFFFRSFVLSDIKRRVRTALSLFLTTLNVAQKDDEKAVKRTARYKYK